MDITQVHAARWTSHEDNDVLILQIELGSNNAVTLHVSKNGDPNIVRIWSGNGEQTFEEQTLKSFKQWLEETAKP
jgi:outer membrane biosynthesis protein TonB